MISIGVHADTTQAYAGASQTARFAKRLVSFADFLILSATGESFRTLGACLVGEEISPRELF